MESIEQTLTRIFPAQLTQSTEVSMAQLSDLKKSLKAQLPPESMVELTILMNSILLNAYVDKKWHHRSCTIEVRP